MAVTTNEARTLRRAWATFLGGNSTASEARPEIVASWRRSQLSRVSVDHLKLPFTPLGMAESKLLMAAGPVINDFADGLAGSPVSVVLADRTGRVVGRWTGERVLERRLEAESISIGFVLTEEHAGTNGIGTALEMRRPVKVYGPEHYAQALHGLTCAGAPLRNPLSRQLEGVVNLACPNTEVNALLLPTVIDLSRRIEREMHARSTHREQAVLEAFLLANRTVRGPIIAISDTFLMANSAAGPLLDGAEQAVLWQQVPDGLGAVAIVAELQLDHGTVQATFRGVVVGGRTVGSIIEFDCARPVRRHHRPDAAAAAAARAHAAGLVGRSASWRHVCLTALNVHPDLPVVIIGEPGTGKRALAEFLHTELGNGKLRVISAGLEQIHGHRRWLRSVHQIVTEPGTRTVLIPEIQDLSPECARSLEDLLNASDVRPLLIATATTATTARGTTAALVDRLSAQTVAIPPLRERPTDIQPIAEHILSSLGEGPTTSRLSADAITTLSRYPWPGNVRELESVLGQASAHRRGHVMTTVDLPLTIRSNLPSHGLSRVETVERDTIRQALLEADGNKSAAAIALGLSRKTLYRRIQRYRLDDNGGF